MQDKKPHGYLIFVQFLRNYFSYPRFINIIPINIRKIPKIMIYKSSIGISNNLYVSLKKIRYIPINRTTIPNNRFLRYIRNGTIAIFSKNLFGLKRFWRPRIVGSEK